MNYYFKFCSEIKKGSLGKTGQFWYPYRDYVWLLLQLVHAVKMNDFMQYMYANCISLMPDLFFSFGGQNYARYLTFYSTYLANIEESHPGATEILKQGAMSVARSIIPGNRFDVDKTMEETFMKQAKSRVWGGAGLMGIANKYNAYQGWVKTTHVWRSKYLESTLSLVNMEGAKKSTLR